MPLSLAPLALYYLSYFGTYGVLLPVFAPYFRSLGLDASQIGVLASLAPICGALTPFAWGYLSDRFQRRVFLLRIATALSLVGMAGLLVARSFWMLALTMGLYAFFRAPLIAFIDTLALISTKKSGASFSSIRMFGSMGFVLGSSSFGVWAHFDRSAGHGPGMTAAVVVFSSALLASIWMKPEAPTNEARLKLQDALGLLRDRRLARLVLAAALHWMTLSPYHVFFAAHVEDLGLSPFVAGFGMAAGSLAEVLLMWKYSKLSHRDPRLLLIIAFSVTALRWVITAVSEDALVLLTIQTLHAFSFGLFYLTTVTTIVGLVPDRLRATGQGLFLAILGASSFVGSLGSGYLLEHYGGRGMFLVAAGVSVIAVAFATRIRVAELRGESEGEGSEPPARTDPPPVE